RCGDRVHPDQPRVLVPGLLPGQGGGHLRRGRLAPGPALRAGAADRPARRALRRWSVKDDVTSHLDQLRRAVDEARSVPMSASVMINRSDFHAMLDDLERVTDKMLSDATELVGDRDAVVALGSEEAEEI